jgi:hypothetical protein
VDDDGKDGEREFDRVHACDDGAGGGGGFSGVDNVGAEDGGEAGVQD